MSQKSTIIPSRYISQNFSRYSALCGKNIFWLLAIIIVLPLFLLGKHVDLLISHRKNPVITIGYTGYSLDRESRFLADIALITLENNGLKSRLQRIEQNDLYYGLDGAVDFMILPLSSYKHLGIDPHNAAAMNFSQFYCLYSSYWPVGVEVGDPSEGDSMHNNISHDARFGGFNADHIFVPVYQSRIYTPQLRNILGFLTGELSYSDIAQRLKENSRLSLHILAEKWWNTHTEAKN